jgi:hypothetical protein
MLAKLVYVVAKNVIQNKVFVLVMKMDKGGSWLPLTLEAPILGNLIEMILLLKYYQKSTLMPGENGYNELLNMAELILAAGLGPTKKEILFMLIK